MYKKDGQKAARRPRRAATCGGDGVDPPPPPRTRLPTPRRPAVTCAARRPGGGGRWARALAKGGEEGATARSAVRPARPPPSPQNTSLLTAAHTIRPR